MTLLVTLALIALPRVAAGADRLRQAPRVEWEGPELEPAVTAARPQKAVVPAVTSPAPRIAQISPIVRRGAALGPTHDRGG